MPTTEALSAQRTTKSVLNIEEAKVRILAFVF